MICFSSFGQYRNPQNSTLSERWSIQRESWTVSWFHYHVQPNSKLAGLCTPNACGKHSICFSFSVLFLTPSIPRCCNSLSDGLLYVSFQIRKASEDSDTYEDNKPRVRGSLVETSGTSELSQLEIPTKEMESESIELTEATAPQEKINYQRTLSGGLQSPRAEVPKTAILQRINSKSAARSYQLGHQLSLKWSTGAGPRIGCVADYPLELRQQALEFVNLSPRRPPTPSTYRDITILSPSGLCPSAWSSNGCGSSPQTGIIISSPAVLEGYCGWKYLSPYYADPRLSAHSIIILTLNCLVITAHPLWVSWSFKCSNIRIWWRGGIFIA